MKVLSAVLALSLLAAGSSAQTPLVYVELDQPCRLLDTRLPDQYPGSTGPLIPGVVTPLDTNGLCGIPWGARAIEANVTVTNTQGAGYLSLMKPTGRIPANPQPATSLLNFSGPGQTVANGAMIGLWHQAAHGWDGSFWMVAGVSGADVLVDVSGYYLPLP